MVAPGAMSIADALACQHQLESVSDTAGLDVSLLLCHVLDRPRSYLYTWPERLLEPAQQAQFCALLERRRTGEPVAHILGYREFWSLPLQVNAHTLIPRPDTECLVELALSLCQNNEAGRLLDLGTGTGALALALASEWPRWQCWALDRSPEAAALAEQNRHALGLDNVRVAVSDWFTALDASQPFHLIISNPPYIDAQDPHLDQGDVRFEPASALVSPESGLADLRHIVGSSMPYLADNGYLLVEHGYQQASAVRTLFVSAGFVSVETHRDYGGNERMTVGQKVVQAKL